MRNASRVVICKQCTKVASTETTVGIPGTEDRRHRHGVGCMRVRISRPQPTATRYAEMDREFRLKLQREDARLRGVLRAAGISLEASA